jgi:hypothetical protein
VIEREVFDDLPLVYSRFSFVAQRPGHCRDSAPVATFGKGPCVGEEVGSHPSRPEKSEGVSGTGERAVDVIEADLDGVKVADPSECLRAARVIRQDDFRAQLWLAQIHSWSCMMARFSSRKPRALLALAIAGVIAAGIVIPLEVMRNSGSARTGSSSTSRPAPSGATKPTLPQSACAKSGCAVVNAVLTRPDVTVFYGASCTGPDGSWYLNITQGGPNNAPRLAYRLQWASLNPQSPAHPNGLINVSTPAGEKITMTLSNGVLRLTGHRPNAVDMSATGSLAVRISQTGSGLALTFTETGLAATEQALGITSPFGVDGQPTSVPVKLMPRFSSC